MGNNFSLEALVVNESNMLQHIDLFESFGKILAQEYDYDLKDLSLASRNWLMVKHHQHGIVGGLCLSQPHSHPPFSESSKKLIEFYKHLNTTWVASHLFFYLPEEVLDDIEDNRLSQFNRQIFNELYYKLINLSIYWSIPDLWLLVPEDQYLFVSTENLPMLVNKKCLIEDTSFILSYLTTSLIRKEFIEERLSQNGNARIGYRERDVRPMTVLKKRLMASFNPQYE